MLGWSKKVKKNKKKVKTDQFPPSSLSTVSLSLLTSI